MFERFTATPAYRDSDADTVEHTVIPSQRIPSASYVALEQRASRHVFYAVLEVNGSRRYPVAAGDLVRLPPECQEGEWTARWYLEMDVDDTPAIGQDVPYVAAGAALAVARDRVGFVISDCVFQPVSAKPTVWEFDDSFSSSSEIVIANIPTINAKNATVKTDGGTLFTALGFYGVDGGSKALIGVGAGYGLAKGSTQIESLSIEERTIIDINSPSLIVSAKSRYGYSVNSFSFSITLHASSTNSTGGFTESVSFNASKSEMDFSHFVNGKYVDISAHNDASSTGNLSVAVYKILESAFGGSSSLGSIYSVNIVPGGVVKYRIEVSGGILILSGASDALSGHIFLSDIK